MQEICSHCQALKWRKEPKGMCFQDPPEPLKSLLSAEYQLSPQFLKNIRSYNSVFQVTFFGVNQIIEGAFVPTFKIQGEVYHLIGSLLPINEPKFLQIYFVSDQNEQAGIRHQIIDNLNADLVSSLQSMLHETNPYIRDFKAALELIPQNQQNSYKLVISADKRPAGQHPGRYNAPTTNEVGVVLVDQHCDRRDIVLRARDEHLQRISETHRAYDALQYPLIYCRGEDGYNFGLRQVNPITGETVDSKKVFEMQFYAYILHIRDVRVAHLHRFRSLFNLFLLDVYANIETECLVFIRTNQRRLRAENYVDLRDAMNRDGNSEDLGRLVNLPSSFTGGPRYMHERTQDAFTYVRKYGRNLSITFTTNPKWIEITQELFEGQASHDRHDVVGRVFHLKLKLIMDLLTKENVFGATLCFMYSVEWQKRGLPHAHILLWLVGKIRPTDVDSIISAEFPDPNQNPSLYTIVKAHMMDGPCSTLNANSPCMRYGRCTKRFPKTAVQQTVTGEDGYPSYRRRLPMQGGFSATLNVRGQQIQVDNRWIVPYSPVLSKTFEAHINVEMCNSVQSIKYICKYVNKVSDQATFASVSNNNRDEVSRYQSGRYISSSEAVWRILGFPIHERYPPVTHLDIHLEGQQRIYFDEDNIEERLENPRQTTLLAFFRLCETDDFAKTLLYEEIPAYYTYNKQQGMFNRRRRGASVEGAPGVFKEHNLGRVYTAHPNNRELFYLRLLLHTVRGPTSFSALRTVNGIQQPTYLAACRELQLLDDDQHWDATLAEACVSDSPRQLRHLFAILLVFCGLSEAITLWHKYQNSLAEDFIRSGADVETSVNKCLKEIQDMALSIGGNCLASYGLPEPVPVSDEEQSLNRGYSFETGYDATEIADTISHGLHRLTAEQRAVFNRICDSALNNSGEMFFLDAPGGTGKTFLTKIILAQIRSQGKIALAVASSGIAATLLPGGKTAHAMFKIPIQLETSETPVCDLSRNSDKAKILQKCSLIVWDECTMAHRKAVEAVNRTVQDIKRDNRPMGGITMLFCGDFRQTLPVVPQGTRADEVNACLKSSSLWPHIIRYHLSTNMRAQTGGNSNAQEFSDLLLNIGDDTFPKEEGTVRLPSNLCQTVSSSEELLPAVYGDITLLKDRENSWLCERVILTTRNDQAVAINNKILNRVPGQATVYYSINRVVEQDEVTTYPLEFLNSLSAPGVPSHAINLKVGVPIILLRNLNPPKLCNGTRLRIVRLQQNLIEAEILTGCGAGEQVFIPRIPLIPNNFPFRFKRVQFPVSLCFAMTINKAQGQTLRTAGVDLTTSCFSHGQLYVALSRVCDAANMFVYCSDGVTHNIVYREAL